MKNSKLIPATVFALCFFISWSCRKADQIIPIDQITIGAIEERFFNGSRTEDVTEKALVNYLRRKNEENNFIETTVGRIGFPRWDKAIVTAD